MAYNSHDWSQQHTVKRIGEHMRKAGPIANRTTPAPSGAPYRTYGNGPSTTSKAMRDRTGQGGSYAGPSHSSSPGFMSKKTRGEY